MRLETPGAVCRDAVRLWSALRRWLPFARRTVGHKSNVISIGMARRPAEKNSKWHRVL